MMVPGYYIRDALPICIGHTLVNEIFAFSWWSSLRSTGNYSFLNSKRQVHGFVPAPKATKVKRILWLPQFEVVYESDVSLVERRLTVSSDWKSAV